MFLRSLFLFLGCFITISFISCSGKEEVVDTTESIEDDSQWTDSIYGTLSAEQLYNQHLIIEVPAYYQLQADSLISWIGSEQPGGIHFEDWDPDSISYVKKAIDTLEIIQPFIYANYFNFLELPQYPFWRANPKNRSLELSRVFQKARMNLIDLELDLELVEEERSWLDSLNRFQSIYPVVKHFSDKNLADQFNDFLIALRSTDQNILLSISQLDSIDLNKFREQNSYEGLYIVRSAPSNINTYLKGGADMQFRSIETPSDFASWKGVDESYELSSRRILDLKGKVDNRVKEQHLSPEVKFTQLNLIHNSVSIIKDESKMLPFSGRFSIYADLKMGASKQLRTEVQMSLNKSTIDAKKIDKIGSSSGNKVVILSDSATSDVLQACAKLKKESTTLVCFQNPEHYESLKGTANLLFIPALDKESPILLAQQLSKRLALTGQFVLNDSVYASKTLEKTLLARTSPEYRGYDRDTLARINWMVKNAMNGRAFPGCQVLVAKSGCIIYDQQFGHHSYKREKLVTEESIYDLASITKVVATTLMSMKLWEMNKFELKDSLEEYLPDTLREYLPYPSTIRNITFHELLIHKSGLPAGFPLIRYLDYKTEDIGKYDKYYCDMGDSTYCIEVAQDFYMDREYGDSMWLKLNQMWLDKSKPYKYSDVNMNTMYYMLKGMIDAEPRVFGFTEPAKKLEGRNLYKEYLYNTFYEPLGMDRTRFKPLDHYNELTIVPTENETFWRGQLLRGHVHDPNAALMGGIAGNAGMFSTTNDLVKLCQMWLDKGVYGGQRYLNAETITKFTSVAEDSHRGLGFNKRTISTTGYGMSDSCSIATYGHTGFTGTCFWIDPEEDLIYIFLSNRVHPKVNNRIYQFGIRKRIHNAVFDARLNY